MVLNEKFTIPTVLELFRSLRTIRTDSSLKIPLQKWSYIYGMGKVACIILAIPTYEEDQTLSLFFLSRIGIYGRLCCSKTIHGLFSLDAWRINRKSLIKIVYTPRG